MQWETRICWEVPVQTSHAPNGIISSSCRGNTISPFRPLILSNHRSKETEVNLKHANSILNKGNKDIGQIYLPEHSMVGNMLSFRGSADWPGLRYPQREGGTLSFYSTQRELTSETWGNPMLDGCPMLFRVLRRKYFVQLSPFQLRSV